MFKLQFSRSWIMFSKLLVCYSVWLVCVFIKKLRNNESNCCHLLLHPILQLSTFCPEAFMSQRPIVQKSLICFVFCAALGYSWNQHLNNSLWIAIVWFWFDSQSGLYALIGCSLASCSSHFFREGKLHWLAPPTGGFINAALLPLGIIFSPFIFLLFQMFASRVASYFLTPFFLLTLFP